ncbi:MAG: hypothetical protein GX616_12185 [Planctomycetes bacterium]|nr:hypothetical protein [Planctomycetota bacterium]
MAWLRRRRRILKWVGLVMSLLIVLVWSISLGWRVDLQRTDRTPDTQGNYCAIRAYVGNGGFGCYRSVPFQLDN